MWFSQFNFPLLCDRINSFLFTSLSFFLSLIGYFPCPFFCSHVACSYCGTTSTLSILLPSRCRHFYNVIFFVPIYLPSKRKIFFTQHNRSKDIFISPCASRFWLFSSNPNQLSKSCQKILLNTSFRPSLVKNNRIFLTLNWWNMRCIFCQDDGLMFLVHVCVIYVEKGSKYF